MSIKTFLSFAIKFLGGKENTHKGDQKLWLCNQDKRGNTQKKLTKLISFKNT